MLFYCFVDPRVLHSFPTRRSSDLREAGRAGGTAPAVLNAANEVAVGAFLAGGIRFTDIPAVVEHALDRVPIETVRALEQVLEADAAARAAATTLAGAAA